MKFNFQLPNKISKEILLSKYPEEVYMEFYLGIPVRKGLFKNPLRQDNKPTCSFFRGKSGDLLFRDFSGVFLGNFIDVVKAKYGVSYEEALNIIARDFNIIPEINFNKVIKPIRKLEKSFTKIQIEMQDFSKDELLWWNTFSINKRILQKFQVYSCKSIFLNDQLLAQSKFCFGYFGGFNGELELWRIYFPLRKNYRFISNWPATKIQGLEQLPVTGNLLVITKSMKDVMCLYSLGICAIAPNSETLFINPDILEDLKNRFKYIICFYDNDLPGIHNMNKIKKQHPELIYTWIPRKYNAKDISDFHKMYGHSKTKDLIIQFIQWLKHR